MCYLYDKGRNALSVDSLKTPGDAESKDPTLI